jgi:hypothetical protein
LFVGEQLRVSNNVEKQDMPNLKVEMRLLNTRHVASSGTRGVGDLIFSESAFTVEHE